MAKNETLKLSDDVGSQPTVTLSWVGRWPPNIYTEGMDKRDRISTSVEDSTGYSGSCRGKVRLLVGRKAVVRVLLVMEKKT